MEQYDLMIIGGGPAGYLAGERAGAGGLKTAVVEKRFLGGVCLNEGCIPSKALLYSAKLYDQALHGEAYGVTVTGAAIDHRRVVERKNKVVKLLTSGVAAKLKRQSVHVITGEARLEGGAIGGFALRVGEESYRAGKLLLACGSLPVIPPIPGVREGLESGFVLTSREILELTEAPGALVVIGGGVVGLEMACYFATIGSKVTVVEQLERIAGPTDAEISKLLLGELRKKGIDFHLGASVVAVGVGSVTFVEGGETKTVSCDRALLSIGRRANTGGLGLNSVGVHTERGAVVTDEHMRTNIPGIYAAGDVNGRSMLAHTAYRESEAAVNHMLGQPDRMRYRAIPSVLYTSPEAAGVGETEETAREKGLDIQVARVSLRASGRYLAEVERGGGICKLVVDRRDQRLLGAHMIGSYVSEIIYGAAMMIETEMRIRDIKEIVFPHPTVGEVIREALFEL